MLLTRCFGLIVLGIFWGCRPTSSTSSSAGMDGLPPIKPDLSPCEALHKLLPAFSAPREITSTNPQQEPLPPSTQAWLREKLLPQAIYTPIGLWQMTPTFSCWLIEATHEGGTFTYAILADSTCEVHDTLSIAGLSAGYNHLRTLTARIEPDGVLIVRTQEHVTDLSGEVPQTTSRTYEKAYRMDRTQRRFVPL